MWVEGRDVTWCHSTRPVSCHTPTPVTAVFRMVINKTKDSVVKTFCPPWRLRSTSPQGSHLKSYRGARHFVEVFCLAGGGKRIHPVASRPLNSDFSSVEHHISSTKPHLLFYIDIQVSKATDSNLHSFSPLYFLFSFDLKLVLIFLAFLITMLPTAFNHRNSPPSCQDLIITLLLDISLLFISYSYLRTI